MSDIDITIKATDEASAVIAKSADETKSLDKAIDSLSDSAREQADATAQASGGLTNLEKAASGTRTTIGGLDKDFQVAGKSIGSAADFLSGFGISIPTTPMEAFGQAAQFAVTQLSAAEQVAAEAAVSNAKLEAVIRATGGAAGLSVSEINGMTDSLAKLNGMDDDTVRQAETVMLTFKNIGEETFPRAQQAAIDMALALDGNVVGATMQLSKALNDPIAGLGSLADAGVKFTDQQKEMIKGFVETGNVAAAQNIILSEVEGQVGGTGAAMEAAGDGSAGLSLAIGNLQEAIGTGLIPVVRAWNEYLASSAEGWTAFINGASNAISVNQRVTDILKEQGLTMDAQRAAMTGETLATQEQIAAAKEQIAAEDAAKNAIEQKTAAVEENTVSEAERTAAIQAMTAANTEWLGLIGQVSSAEQSYATTMSGLEEQRAATLEKINALKAQGAVATEGSPLAGMVDELASIDAKITETSVNYAEQMNQMIAADLLKRLSVGGLTDEETAYFEKVQLQMGLITQQQLDQAAAVREQAAALAAAAPGQNEPPVIDTTYLTATTQAATDTATAQTAAQEASKLTAQTFSDSSVTEQAAVAASLSAWENYTASLDGMIGTLIERVQEYINKLNEIPKDLTTNLSLTGDDIT